jgi:drug/metabolite transporter (DMT)-like permease
MKNRGIVFIICSAIGYGLLPVFTRIAFNNNTNLYEMLFLRFTMAIILFSIYLLISGKVRGLRVTKGIIFRCALLGGVLFAFTSFTVFGAVIYLPPSMAEILYFTYPAVVMIFSIVLYKEGINFRKILCLVIILAGIMLIVDVNGMKISAIGVILALSSSLIYSLYVLYIKNEEIQRTDGLVVAFYVMVFADFTYFIFGMFGGSFHFKLTPLGYLVIAAMAIFSTIISLITFIYGSKYLKASEIAIVGTLEPVITVIADALILKQNINFKMLSGIVLILVSILILSLKDKSDLKHNANVVAENN